MSRLIDADALLKFVEDRYEITWESDTYEGGIKDACSDIIEKIDNMPTIESRESRWIPCSEKLPDNGRQVLVYARSVHFALAKYDEMREADGTYKKQWVTFDAWKPFYTIKEVIAWRELPEPYAKRRQDE